MNIGDTQKINVTTTPTEGLIEDLEYTSGSPTIATVGADGNNKRNSRRNSSNNNKR